jgi:phenylacetate-CoA ligase
MLKNAVRKTNMNIRIMLGLLHTLEQLRRHEGWTRRQLEAYQAAALYQLRQYAYERSPFYQTFHKGLTASPLHELPVLTKSMMMEHFDELVTDRSLHLQDIRAYATQGEAGQPYQNHY